jgi:hypothetical protein
LCRFISVQNIELKDAKWQGMADAQRHIPDSITYLYIQKYGSLHVSEKIMSVFFMVWRAYCCTLKQPDNNSSVLLLNQSVVWAQATDYFPS